MLVVGPDIIQSSRMCSVWLYGEAHTSMLCMEFSAHNKTSRAHSHACRHVHTRMRIPFHIRIHAYVHTLTHTHTKAHVYVRARLHTLACTHTRTEAHTHTHTHIEYSHARKTRTHVRAYAERKSSGYQRLDQPSGKTVSSTLWRTPLNGFIPIQYISLRVLGVCQNYPKEPTSTGLRLLFS